MVVPFAHLGHWYVGLPVYLSPVLVVVALLKWSEWREKRRKRRAEDPSGAAAPPSSDAP